MVPVLRCFSKRLPAEERFVSIRDESCVFNTSHCHCAWALPSSERICYRPAEEAGREGVCFNTPCRAGYRCQCGTDSICRKWPITYFRMTSMISDTEASCQKDRKVVPRKVVQKKVIFRFQAFSPYSFLNVPNIIFSEHTGAYRVLSSTISSQDRLAIVAERMNNEKVGIKLRFHDMVDKVSTFDNRWLCSNDTNSEVWREKTFDPKLNGWKALTPIQNPVNGNGFDKDTPWMWLRDENGAPTQTLVCVFVVP